MRNPNDDHSKLAAAKADSQHDQSHHSESHEGSSDLSFKSEFTDKNTQVTKIESKTFPGIPREWHETI